MRASRVLALVFAIMVLLAVRHARPYKGFQGHTFVDIPRGTSAGGIARLLADARVIRSRWDFLAVRLVRHRRVLQAGEYAFDHPSTALDVYDRIARGDIFYRELIVPEGQNMFDIAAAAGRLGFFQADAFLDAARDPSPIRDLDPQAPTLEGYLFPDTYRLGRHTTPEGLCRVMTAKFREAWRGLHAAAGVHDTVTLASLVEKEGKLGDERPRIAAVFENRLRIGMKLDCDPTTIYAALLDGRYRGAIYKSDLASDSPYNTYRHAGLPPGPIANPGVASLNAVLHPDSSDALFFVLRPGGSGAHEFSKTIEAHEAAAAQYHRGLHKRAR